MTTVTTLTQEQVDEIFGKISILLDSIMVSDAIIRHEIRNKLQTHEELTVELLSEAVQSSARKLVANQVRGIVEDESITGENKIIEIRKNVRESIENIVTTGDPVRISHSLTANNEWKHILMLILTVEDPECFA